MRASATAAVLPTGSNNGTDGYIGGTGAVHIIRTLRVFTDTLVLIERIIFYELEGIAQNLVHSFSCGTSF